MRTEVVIKFTGYVLLFNALFLLIAFFISLFHGETSTIPLLFSGLICIIFGAFPFIFVEDQDNVSFSEGLAIVVGGWVITCIIGMLPYIMWGGEFSLVNAWFESVSGFTTTGSSILNNIEALPKGLLFWRSATHWIGGIGIVMFVLLILPQSTSSRLTLLNAEMSELSKLNFRYKARKIIHVLIIVYVGLTAVQTLTLWALGMSLFDAINHSFATIATGGFSTKNSSVAFFKSPSIEIVIMIFMVLSGMHFGLLYGTITGRAENIFKSSVAKSFIVILLLGILLVSAKLYFSGYYNIWDSLRFGSFQVISLGTTTGFATADSNPWPAFTHIILIYFTIQCAMVGSTSGGLKFDRVYLFFRSLRKQLKLIQHPRAVVVVKINNRVISEQLEALTMVFVVLYIFTFFVTTLVLTSLDVDLYTAFSASIATIGNVGPGFGDVSSLANFSTLPSTGKFVLTLNMLLGRLEIFNIIALLMVRKGNF
ncbi:MAG TPA: potassium transporter TrkG [Tenuifilaceae bacterium]|nr:potassium transporter TrkG [Tenuifilaceae bacterium]HPE18658.1 potassium transporter TrkG [Tenuifilaceae bacterium]HPJ45567.1 potassium transporter TrkG [Tenuifilaceae bacterium]HPQ33673.1 potassium transporter TrkG [Tenuifilaceae bacterium]HRX68010.1 potassium transporter TrkG [Tenuifilaceae bacterium]